MENMQINLWERMREYRGSILIILLVAFPVILWAMMQPLETRFSTFTAAFTSFGQILGLVGMALFATSLILGAVFGKEDGENFTYRLTGIVGFFLLLFHPLFLAAKYISISLGSAALFLLPGGDAGVNLGIYALLALIALALIVISARSRYSAIRGAYRFLGVVFMTGGLHAFFVGSDIAYSPVLRWYMIGLTVFALSAYLYRTVLEPLFRLRPSYKPLPVPVKKDDGMGV